LLLGVRAVIAESFERIHRSNLIGMGVLPLEFTAGATARSLGLTGRETFDIGGLQSGDAKTVTVVATPASGAPIRFAARVRIDTPKERDYFKNGGILHYVLRQLAKPGAKAPKPRAQAGKPLSVRKAAKPRKAKPKVKAKPKAKVRGTRVMRVRVRKVARRSGIKARHKRAKKAK